MSYSDKTIANPIETPAIILSNRVATGVSWSTVIHRNIGWSDLEHQKQLAVNTVQSNPTQAVLLLSEPTPTFTYGRFASPSDQLWSTQMVKARGIDISAVNRGGKWTYHGPGQVVVYPIVCLSSLKLNRHAVFTFLSILCQGVKSFVQSLGIAAAIHRKPFGLYVNSKKLVSFGISIQRGISGDGFALYVTDQTRNFSGIRACGVKNEQFTSLHELGVCMDWLTVAYQLSTAIKKSFTYCENRVPL